MYFIGERELRGMQETWPDVQVMSPYESKLTVAMEDGRAMLLTQQTWLLTASGLTSWAPVAIELAVVA